MDTFTRFDFKNLSLKNKIVMPPMCMYSADETGTSNDFHYAHYMARAIGEVGLIIVEATGVSPIGRISDSDLGLWNDEQIPSIKKLATVIKQYGAQASIQLNHAGRKYEGASGTPVAPSPIKSSDEYPIPKELNKEEIKEIITDFKEAAKRANEAGFDALEVHGAHGYLIHQFLSPLSNVRTDEYGGSLENRTRFLKEILEAISEVWPKEKAIILRISATDYTERGITPDDMVAIINLVKEYIDIAHVSSGGLIFAKIKTYPGYQVRLSEKIRQECKIPTIAVGLITELNMIEEILANERADLVAIGRELLRNPQFVLQEAYKNNIDIAIPKQYKRAF